MALEKYQVLGVSRHKGEFEGRSYDFSKIFIVAAIGIGSPDKVGFNAVEMRGVPKIFDQLKSQVFPCEVGLEVSLEAKGAGESKSVITNAEPEQASIKKVG